MNRNTKSEQVKALELKCRKREPGKEEFGFEDGTEEREREREAKIAGEEAPN